MIQIRKFFNKKGQGIVEYAVLLAVIVGLAVFLNDGSLGDGVQSSFDNVVALFRGEDVKGQGQSGYVALNKRGKNQLHDYTTGQDLVDDKLRIEADQQALANIAEFFMGKTKEAVVDALGGKMGDGYNTQGTLLLDYKDWTEEGGYTDGDIKTGKSDYSGAGEHTNNRIYNWMQGDYGKIDTETGKVDPNSYNADYNYDAGTRYLVSNYMINPNSATPNSNSKYIDNRAVRVVLTYDGTGNSATVKEARVYVTRGERGTENSGIRELDVKMSYDSNGNTTWKQTTEGTGYYTFNKNVRY